MTPGLCPVCGATDARAEATFTVEEAARFFSPGRDASPETTRLAQTIRRLWGRDSATNRVCVACDFGFADPNVAGDGEFYDLFFGSSHYPEHKWEFTRTVAALKGTAMGRRRVLEVGAGWGHFLSRVTPSIWAPDKVTVIEYNPVARTHLQSLGYDTHATDVRAIDLPDESCDAIFLFQVLEHLDRPHDVFARIRNLLAPGGHAFFAVPNVGFVRFIGSNGSLADMPPNHIGRWSHANFRHMAGQHGLDLMEIEDEPFDLADFVKQDLVYSYKQRAVEGRGLAARLYPSRRTRVGRAANAAMLGLQAGRRLPVWWKAHKMGNEIGASRWCHMRKL